MAPDTRSGPGRNRGHQETREASVTRIYGDPDIRRLLELHWRGWLTRAEFEDGTGLDYAALTAAEPSTYSLPAAVLAEHVRRLRWRRWETAARFDLRRARRERAA